MLRRVNVLETIIGLCTRGLLGLFKYHKALQNNGGFNTNAEKRSYEIFNS